ncbi:MAG: DUF904 domain-containing protein [Motiliproteus sp.]
MSETPQNNLHHSVEQLISYCQRLELQNQQLKTSEQALKLERNRLLLVRDKTQKRVEAMISRLKAMES